MEKCIDKLFKGISAKNGGSLLNQVVKDQIDKKIGI